MDRTVRDHGLDWIHWNNGVDWRHWKYRLDGAHRLDWEYGVDGVYWRYWIDRDDGGNRGYRFYRLDGVDRRYGTNWVDWSHWGNRGYRRHGTNGYPRDLYRYRILWTRIRKCTNDDAREYALKHCGEFASSAIYILSYIFWNRYLHNVITISGCRCCRLGQPC